MIEPISITDVALRRLESKIQRLADRVDALERHVHTISNLEKAVDELRLMIEDQRDRD